MVEGGGGAVSSAPLPELDFQRRFVQNRRFPGFLSRSQHLATGPDEAMGIGGREAESANGSA